MAMMEREKKNVELISKEYIQMAPMPNNKNANINNTLTNIFPPSYLIVTHYSTF